MRVMLGIALLLLVAGVAGAQPFPGRDLSLSGSLIHLIEPSGKLDIIDASDPTALALRGQIDPNPGAQIVGVKVVSYGTTAYVLEQRLGEPTYSILTVIDGSSPNVPVAVMEIVYPEYAMLTGLAVDTEHAVLYVGYDQLCSYDLSDPLHPVLLQQRDLDYYRPVADIQTQGTIAYCAQGHLDAESDDIFGIALVETSDPADMDELTYIANYPTRFRDCFRIDGDLLFSTSHEEMYDPNHYFQIHDLSDPYAPQLLAEIITPRHGHVMRRWGDIIYHTGGSAGVGRIRVSELAAPEILDPLPGTAGVVDIEIREDGWLFAAAESGAGLCAFNLQATATPMDGAPTPLRLAAWPNPFNPQASITFTLPSAQRACVSIHAVDGRRLALLASRLFGAGEQRLRWNGTDDDGRQQASGVYLVRVDVEGLSATQRLVLLR